jgi:hypothetical protein
VKSIINKATPHGVAFVCGRIQFLVIQSMTPGMAGIHAAIDLVKAH